MERTTAAPVEDMGLRRLKTSLRICDASHAESGHVDVFCGPTGDSKLIQAEPMLILLTKPGDRRAFLLILL